MLSAVMNVDTNETICDFDYSDKNDERNATLQQINGSNADWFIIIIHLLFRFALLTFIRILDALMPFAFLSSPPFPAPLTIILKFHR